MTRDGIVGRLALAHDASHYLVVPAAVRVAEDVGDVVRILRQASPDRPVTFRSGGTSLSGQAQGRGLLVDTRRSFRSIDVLDDGQRVRVGPGATVRQVNAHLAPFGCMLGPDPASEAACTVGGVVANNSSGMTCGTAANAYRTVSSMVLVLADGTVVDTGVDDADARLRAAAPAVHAGLCVLRDRVRADPGTVREIERQFAIKNTMGYGVNAFLDFDDPVDILAHLVVGSEGTLAFVAEVTFRTVPIRPHVATGLLVFDSLHAATSALSTMVETAPAAIELMDEASLQVSRRDPRGLRVLPDVAGGGHAGLLVEYQESTADELAARVAMAAPRLAALATAGPADLVTDSARRADLWHLRKGLYAAVAGERPSGTSALLEDVAVPVPELADTCVQLLGLFERHDYRDCVVFGHAKDGNIHFLLNERFDDPASLGRYEAFTEDMAGLVLNKGGTLKAEHGTGRIMAPFVRRQYGEEIYRVMRAVKDLLDPRKILNPDVVLTDDPSLHLRDLKTTPTVDPEVDRCVECGYCEPVCPSRDLTLTPRQRIVMRREQERARDCGDDELAQVIEDAFGYGGVQTCAVDGMCGTVCPLHIDTGELVKRLRSQSLEPAPARAWLAASRHWSTASTMLRTAMSTAHAVPRLASSATYVARRIVGEDVVPLWQRGLPPGGRRRRPLRLAGHPGRPSIVYFPSCTSTLFGPDGAGEGVAAAVVELCRRTGVEVIVPSGIADLCCGTPWRSKGAVGGHLTMQERLMSVLGPATAGRRRIVVDASSCTEGLMQAVPELTVVDAVEFVAHEVLPHLTVRTRSPRLVLHPTCSSVHLGLDASLRAIASVVADEVVVPVDWGCCGFAGDRGLLHPELTRSATRAEAAAVASVGPAVHASCNRTCEVGMTRATGQTYRHLLEILATTTHRS